MDLEEKFWQRVEKGPECWLWTGATTTSSSGKKYGRLYFQNRYKYAHRFAYWLKYKRWPKELDHRCNETLCVRVHKDHVRATSHRINVRRQGKIAKQVATKRCPAGHPLTGDNLYRYNGGRYCRKCRRKTNRESMRRTKQIPPERWRK